MTTTSSVAIITGASRGIGRATALLLAKHSYAICVNDNQNKAVATEVIQEIRNSGDHAIAVQADISNKSSFRTRRFIDVSVSGGR